MTDISKLAKERIEELNAEIAKTETEKKAIVKKQSLLIQDVEETLKRLKAEQKARLEKIENERIADWLKLRMHIPKSTNRQIVEHRLNELYEAMEWKKPKWIVYTQNPSVFNPYGASSYSRTHLTEALSDRARRLTDYFEPHQRNQDPFQPISIHLRILNRVLRVREFKEAKLMEDLLREVLDFKPLEQFAVVLEKPAVVHFTLGARKRLHNQAGPAIIWRDNTRSWWLNGVSITESTVEGKPTLKRIRAENNAERKRLLIERFGEEAYLKARYAVLYHEDDKGKLWRIKDAQRLARPKRTSSGFNIWFEDECYIQVYNATAEPDGSIRSFFLRVPPEMTTASEAVAWTFKKNKKDYNPSQET